MLARFLLAVAMVVAATPLSADEKAKKASPESHADAKIVALSAVTAIWLNPDAEQVAKLFDATAARGNDGPGSALKAIVELKEIGPEFFKNTSVREIILFTDADLPGLRKRFPKNEMWGEGRVPDHVDKGLGCLIVWRKLVGSKRAREQVRLNVMILKQVKDAHKIVYIDDSP